MSALHEALLAHSRDLVTVVTAAGVVTYANRRPTDLLGSEGDDEAVGRESLSYVHPDDVPRAAEHRRWLLEQPGRSGTCVLRVRAEDGWRHLEAVGINLCHDPDVGGILFISRDVEERVKDRAVVERGLEAQRLVADLGLIALTEPELGVVLVRVLAGLADWLEVEEAWLTDVSRDLLPSGGVGVRRDASTGASRIEAVDEPLTGPEGDLGTLHVEGRAASLTDSELATVRAVGHVISGALLMDRRRTDELHEALHDPLTGLATRPLFLERLERTLARRDGLSAVVLLDLDRFKAVNDTFGHAAGDELLAELGPRLRACCRPTDTVARYGGDEFVILCEGADSASIRDLVSRVRRACAEPFPLSNGMAVIVAGSIGVAWGEGPDACPAELLAAADRAMYTDKGERR